jgi:signal transduction histidine kinase
MATSSSAFRAVTGSVTAPGDRRCERRTAFGRYSFLDLDQTSSADRTPPSDSRCYLFRMSAGLELAQLSVLPSEDALRLLAFAQDLSSLREIAGVAEIVKRAARDLIGSDGVTFVLREGEQVFYVDEDAIGPLWKGRRFPADACISGWAILNRQSVIIPDIYEDPRIPVTAYRSTFVKSLLMVPIAVNDPVGALGAYWATNHRADDRERTLLETIAGFTSVAVANARLYQERSDAVRARDEWMKIASHELKTPLTPLTLDLHRLRAQVGDDASAPDPLRQQASRMDRCVRRLSRLVDQLLDYSHLSRSDLAIQAESFDLVTVAADVCETFRLDSRLASPNVDLRARSPVVGTWDRVRVEQVLMNLVSNAVRHGGGEAISIEVAGEGGFARVAVADRGPGIPPEHHERIFQPFARLDPNDQGAGLGLWIVRKILQAHGGHIEVQSQPGQGTTMVVSLPLARRAPVQRPHAVD